MQKKQEQTKIQTGKTGNFRIINYKICMKCDLNLIGMASLPSSRILYNTLYTLINKQ
jgi:hypothetical protein